MPNKIYQIKYSSPTRYGVYVDNGIYELSIRENMTEQEAIDLKQSLIQDAEDNRR